MNDHIRNITGNVPENIGDENKADYIESLFSEPAPEGWLPKDGERVWMRPDMTIGGVRANPVTVIKCFSTTATVGAQIARRTKTRGVLLEHLRPL
jgi:hypothetical protein